ncbi:DUF2478 domain-containing protein [Acidimangrovimonas pyrenivorans]|uniref:DUF2478 domain-containing protein n=1 Tax=Acidimangrovimonas pyrenivorans TaxID=2030798 RepID=A0ABV7AJ10_9RHOB
MYSIATVRSPGRGDTDLLLARFAEHATGRGLRVCGTVQINSERVPAHACDMDIKVLPDGPVLRISQALGAGSRGCRLDPAALEQAVAGVERALQGGADLLIVNKFGKMEAEGRGLRGVIAEAVARSIPVLVGVNGLNADALEDFAAGMRQPLAPDIAALSAWLDAVQAGRAVA